MKIVNNLYAVMLAVTTITLPNVTFAQGLSLAPGNPINMTGNSINNLANPANSTDAANKGYVDDANSALEARIAANEATIAALSASILANTANINTLISPPESCLAHLIGGSTANGWYEIMLPGSQNSPTIARLLVYCDMTTDGGGWTVIDFQDFDDVTANGWSDQRIDSANCGAAYSPLLGGFNIFGAGASTQRNYDLLGVPHTEIHVVMDYIAIDSWDGENRIFEIDGAEQIGSPPPASGSNICGGPWPDGKESFSFQIGHTANTALLYGSSTLDSPPDDESWGIDNVLVMVR